MKNLALTIAIAAALTACTEKTQVQSAPKTAYELTQKGDTSVISVMDGDSQEVMFVFSDSSILASGMEYEKIAEACQASIKEARTWPLYPQSFKYNGPSQIISKDGQILIIVEGMLQDEPTKFIMKAKSNGTVERERVI